MKPSFLPIVLLCLSLLTCGAEPVANLATGDYTLSFTSMSFTATPTPEEKEIALPVRLKTEASTIVIETRGSDGKSMKMSGRIKGTENFLWMSELENDKIVTYHLTGKIAGDHAASGNASIFGSHQRVGSGKWSLTPTK